MTRIKQPGWTELRAKNIKPGRTKILGIVLHDTAGSGKHGDTLYLAKPGDGRPVSVDFTVERDGSIWKLNPDLTKFYCNHAGRATRFKGFSNGQVNRVTIGIEIVQKADLSLKPVYPDVQVASVAELCAWLTERFSLSPGDITTHRNIITDGSRSDPRVFPFEGERGFWACFWNLKGKVDEAAASRVMKKTPSAENEYKVAAGDTPYAIAQKLKIKLDDLLKVNPGIDKTLLIGQVIFIPRKLL